MNQPELSQTNGKNSNESNNTNIANLENSSESDEDMKLFPTRDQHLNHNESNDLNLQNPRSSQSHLHSHQIHSKPIRKEKSEKISSKRSTMDDVLKKLNKYNSDNETNIDNNQNLLTNAFDLAEMATASNDRRNIQETEQRLTVMIEQLQHLRQKLVSQQQVSVNQLYFSISLSYFIDKIVLRRR